MHNLVEDLEAVTGVPKLQLSKIIDKANYCISEALVESFLLGEDTASIDLGFGVLLLKVSDAEIKYRFEPSKALEETLKKTAKTKKSSLVEALETSLVSKITNAYKELF